MSVLETCANAHPRRRREDSARLYLKIEPQYIFLRRWPNDGYSIIDSNFHSRRIRFFAVQCIRNFPPINHARGTYPRYHSAIAAVLFRDLYFRSISTCVISQMRFSPRMHTRNFSIVTKISISTTTLYYRRWKWNERGNRRK